MDRIFHITDAAAWRAARQAGTYAADTLESEGFIHFSLRSQVEQVANARFVGRTGLVVLEVDAVRAGAPVRMENTEGGTELFPHLYGPLDVSAVVSTHTLTADPTGHLTLTTPTDP